MEETKPVTDEKVSVLTENMDHVKVDPEERDGGATEAESPPGGAIAAEPLQGVASLPEPSPGVTTLAETVSGVASIPQPSPGGAGDIASGGGACGGGACGGGACGGGACGGGACGGGACGGSQSHSVEEFLGPAVQGQDAIELFAVNPLPWCPHLKEVTSVPTRGLHTLDPCMECGNVGENWVCLQCYEVHCSRYVHEHMLMHSLETDHRVALSYADLSAWCYACDAYVHNQLLLPAKNSAHMSKFGEDLPGS